MGLVAGTKLGPYEITEPLGAGGMGEVYRARDQRLRRDVAIKVLPSSFATDQERLSRFEQEAQATAALNHPNILAVYDFGRVDGSPYTVIELLEGETLRERIKGRSLPLRKAIEYGIQIARGLSAAHQKGIIHRDLKPENIFITSDGRVKILDFGLAKLTQEGFALHTAHGSATTMLHESVKGSLVGTVGYMSPEQVRGKPVDARSDVFALGAVLYEMVSGRRAFEGASPADTISAILNNEPAPLDAVEQPIAPALDRIVRHCLEKNPDERFQSARDIAFDLEALSTPSSVSGSALKIQQASLWSALRKPALVGVLVVMGLALGFLAATRTKQAQPEFRKLTFRRGRVTNARFASDQQSVIYSAAWEGRPSEVFSTVPNRPDARSLGISNAMLYGVSEEGEAAIGLNPRVGPNTVSTLARVSLAGGVPRELMENVQSAEWGADGKLSIIYDINGMSRLEYPIGKILAETNGRFTNARISRDGSRIAVLEHESRYDYAAHVSLIDANGKKTDLSPHFENAEGLAWSADGKEIWFTASNGGTSQELYAVSLAGKLRSVLRAPGSLQLKDIAKDGRVLIARDALRLGITVQLPGEASPRDLSWFDYSFPHDITEDGKTVLFSEQGDAVGNGQNISYVRNTDGSPAVQISDGDGDSLSPDLKFALVVRINNRTQELLLVPLKAGEPRKIPTDGLDVESAAFLPDGKRIVLLAKENGHAGRVYVQDLESNQRKAISPEGVTISMVAVALKCISPDGKWVVLNTPDGMRVGYSTEGAGTRELPGITRTDVPVSFTRDGKSLFVYDTSENAPKTYKVELETGRRTFWNAPVPSERTGVVASFPSKIIQDGNGYMYPYRQILSDLYVVTGLN